MSNTMAGATSGAAAGPARAPPSATSASTRTATKDLRGCVMSSAPRFSVKASEPRAPPFRRPDDTHPLGVSLARPGHGLGAAGRARGSLRWRRSGDSAMLEARPRRAETDHDGQDPDLPGGAAGVLRG